MSYYNDKLDANEQISMEEDIASMIFYHESNLIPAYDGPALGEDDCAELGRQILKKVLSHFRPDLMED